MKRPAIALAAAVLSSSAAFAAQVTNVIDNMTTFQSLSAENNSVTNTAASGGAIGGFRTITLSSTGNDPGLPTSLSISAANQRMTLNTPEGPTPAFELRWAGAGGTNGLGGIDFGAGQPIDLFTSILSFSLRSTDQANDFTWTFTDTFNQTASYTGTFPVHSSGDPILPYNVALISFTNASAVSWNSIGSITFSGGGVTGLDMSVPAPFQVVTSTVPEPGTWALLVTGVVLATLALHRKAKQRA